MNVDTKTKVLLKYGGLQRDTKTKVLLKYGGLQTVRVDRRSIKLPKLPISVYRSYMYVGLRTHTNFPTLCLYIMKLDYECRHKGTVN